MAKVCLTHKDQPAVAMCHQCHKPICKACTMVTPHGTFCSSECSVISREYKEKVRLSGVHERKGGAGKVVVLVVLLLIAGVFVIHVAARAGVQAVKPIDFLGKFLPQIQQR